MNGWQRLPFDKVLADETGGNLKTLQSEFRQQGRYPIVDQGKNLIAGYTDESARLCKTSLPAIVFGDHTKSLKFIDFPFCMGADGTKVLRPKIKADAKYIFHYLDSVQLPDAGYSRHFKFLREIEIPLPPPAEQKRIVAILDQADALRRLRQRAIAGLDILGQAIFHEMFGDLRLNPNKYPKEALGDIADVRLGKMLDKGKIRGERHLPYLRNANVRWFSFDLKDVQEMEFFQYELERFRVRPGDLLICEGGEPGRCAVWQDSTREIYYQKALHRARCHENRALPEFIAYWFRAASKQQLLVESVTSATIAHLTSEKIKSLQVISPPMKEQWNFVEKLKRIKWNRKRAEYAMDRIGKLFATLQYNAFRREI